MVSCLNSADDAALHVEGLEKSYVRFQLGPLNFTLSGGVTGLLGANGAGKSTLMKILTGVIEPAAGSISFSDQPQNSVGVGYLPQEFSGPRHVRLEDYLRYVAWCRTTRQWKPDDADVVRVLSQVDLQDRARSKIGSLSGGMVRRLGVAQALLGDPTVLVLDEPTVGLDPLQRRSLRELLRKLAGDRCVFISTHLAEDIAAVADRVLVLDRGQQLFDGSVPDLVRGAGHEEVTGASVEEGFLSKLGHDSRWSEDSGGAPR